MRVYKKIIIAIGHQLNLPYASVCNRKHGHDVKVELELEGSVNKDTGMVIDFQEIKKEILVLDHKFLNEMKEFKDVNPTVENIVSFLLGKLRDKDLFSYIKVKVWETENNYAEDEWQTG